MPRTNQKYTQSWLYFWFFSIMKFQAISALLFASVLHVYGQDCGFVGSDETYFEMNEASEATLPGTLLWQHDIYNVIHSSAVNTTHFPYITGLRYVTYYQYVAADIFQEFPDKIRSQYLERNVTFTCLDGGFKNYYFRLRIHDNNTQPPIFNNIEYNIEATVPWPIESPINGNTMIVVTDADYEESNALISLISTNPTFRAVATRLNPEPYPPAYYYKIEVYMTRANVAPGLYSFILVAYDGINSADVPLNINVVSGTTH